MECDTHLIGHGPQPKKVEYVMRRSCGKDSSGCRHYRNRPAGSARARRLLSLSWLIHIVLTSPLFYILPLFHRKMPNTQCCVPLCKNRGGHAFPTDEHLRNLWVSAIRRNETSSAASSLWTPSDSSVVCHTHFKPSHYQNETYHGEYLGTIFIFT